MEKKKTRIMLILSVLVCVMAVGYAVLAQQLNIKGRASIDSTWRVEITKITEKDQLGGASSKEVPNYTATTANFNVGLVQPGDSISYEVEISNLGTLNAKVDSINVVMDENEAIKYTVSGVTEGDKLAAGSKTTMTVKVEYDSSVTTQPSKVGKDITVTVNYVQDIPGQTIDPVDKAYVIGDRVSFAGSNWHVIANSDKSQDYVTVLKENILTSTELGSYASGECGSYQVDNNMYGCTAVGQKMSAMVYYASDTCSNTNETGCKTDYNSSKVKEYLEGAYINTLGTENLKSVDGTQVRLLNENDFYNSFGVTKTLASNSFITVDDNVPYWVYGINPYWISVIEPNNPNNVITIYTTALGTGVVHGINAVRPVINLLKTSIDGIIEEEPDQTGTIGGTQ